MNGNYEASRNAFENVETAAKSSSFRLFSAILPFALTLLASGWHFLYDLFPYPLVSAFAPVGESLFQHLKIVFYPFLAAWATGSLFREKTHDPTAHFVAGVAGAIAAVMSVISFDYLVSEVFGAPSVLPVHILNTFTSFTIATIIGNRFKDIGSPNSKIIAVVLTLSIVSVCVAVCFNAG